MEAAFLMVGPSRHCQKETQCQPKPLFATVCGVEEIQHVCIYIIMFLFIYIKYVFDVFTFLFTFYISISHKSQKKSVFLHIAL